MEKHVKRIAEELTRIRKHLEKETEINAQEVISMVEASQKKERK